MNIKEKIEKIVNQIKSDPSLKKEFEKDPVKAIEKLLGVDLPDGMLDKVVDGVKAKLTLDNASALAGKLKGLF